MQVRHANPLSHLCAHHLLRGYKKISPKNYQWKEIPFYSQSLTFILTRIESDITAWSCKFFSLNIAFRRVNMRVLSFYVISTFFLNKLFKKIVLNKCNLSDCNGTRTHNNLACKRTLSHLRCKGLWIRAPLQSLQIWCLFQARSSLTFRQLLDMDLLWNAYLTW